MNLDPFKTSHNYEVVFQAKTRNSDTWSIVSEADYRRYKKDPNYVVQMVFKDV